MKKILSLFLVISLVVGAFAACNNAEQTSAPTESAVTTEITTAAPTSQTAKTTSVYQTTIPTSAPLYTLDTIATSEERGKILFMVEENPLNEKVPSKVVITCGEERDVPYLVICGGKHVIYDPERDAVSTSSGLGYANILPVAAREAITNNSDKLPVFHTSSLEKLRVFVNDVEQSRVAFKLVNTIRNSENQDVAFKGNTDGRYFMYCEVTCSAPPIMKDGKVYAQASATYYAFFIVEITE